MKIAFIVLCIVLFSIISAFVSRAGRFERAPANCVSCNGNHSCISYAPFLYGSVSSGGTGVSCLSEEPRTAGISVLIILLSTLAARWAVRKRKLANPKLKPGNKNGTESPT